MKQSSFRAYIITAMAGAEAEIALLSVTTAGDDHDREAIGHVLTELACDDADSKCQEACLRQATRMLVVRHVGKVERLALALLAYGALTDEDAIRGVAGLPPAPVCTFKL